MEYHKIETLYERDNRTHKLKPELILKSRVVGCIKSWRWTEKIDGTNIRINWINGALSFGGRTDNASLPADLVNWLNENVSAEKLAAVFPDTDAVIYGEGYGAGIQKAGRGYCDHKRFIIFDVLVGEKWWLAQENVVDIAERLGLHTVPYIGEMTLEEATEMTRKGFRSLLPGADVEAEGMVGRPIEALFDKNGHRLIVKLKTRDF